MALHATLHCDANASVAFTFTVTNSSDGVIDLEFTSGNVADVAVYPGSKEIPAWRASDGMMFTQALQTITLDPGECLERTYEWSDASSGKYRAEGTLLATNVDVSATCQFRV